MDHARLDPLGEAHAPLHVPGVHGAAQPVGGRVGQPYGLVLAVEDHQQGHRAEDFLAQQRGVLGDPGEHGGFDQVAARRPAYERLRAGFHGLVHERGQGVGLEGVDQRADVGVGLVRVARLEGAHACGELFGELLGDGGVDEDPVGGHADLALVDEAAEDGRVHRVVEVGVVEHDERAVAAELQDRALEVAGGDRPDVPADPVRSRERDDLGDGVGQERVAYLGDVGDQDVQQAGRQPGVLEDLGDHAAAHDRGVLVGLDDDRVAQRQGRGDRLQGHQEREVEGADHRDDAHGEPLDPVLLALDRRGQDPSLGPDGELEGLADELHREVDLVLGLGTRPAELVDHRLDDLLLALLGDPQGALQDGASDVRAGGGPLALGALGAAVGLVHLLDGGHGDGRELLPVEGVDVDDVPRTGTGQPFAVDVLVSQVAEYGHAIPYCERAPVRCTGDRSVIMH